MQALQLQGARGCGVELEAQLLRYASCTTHGHASREGEEEERETPHRLRHTQTRMPAPLTGVAKRVAEQRRPAPSAAAAAAACTRRAASQLIDRAPALQRRRDPCLACQERRRAPRWAGARVELSSVCLFLSLFAVSRRFSLQPSCHLAVFPLSSFSLLSLLPLSLRSPLPRPATTPLPADPLPSPLGAALPSSRHILAPRVYRALLAQGRLF